MLEISTSGLMSGDGKRSGPFRAQPPRPSSTLPARGPGWPYDSFALVTKFFGQAHLRLLLVPLSQQHVGAAGICCRNGVANNSLERMDRPVGRI